MFLTGVMHRRPASLDHIINRVEVRGAKVILHTTVPEPDLDSSAPAGAWDRTVCVDAKVAAEMMHRALVPDPIEVERERAREVKRLTLAVRDRLEELASVQTENVSLRAENERLTVVVEEQALELDCLQTENDHLRAESDQLQTENEHLRLERDELQTENEHLRAERDYYKHEYERRTCRGCGAEIVRPDY
jgi:predicted nuclease with TOPRIM domain